mgnify:CR=1 FL=1
MFRVKGVSWWTEELPSDEEYEEARKNLDAHDWAVDYILTHCAPTSITQKIIPHARADRLTDFLEEVKNRARYTTGCSAIFMTIRRWTKSTFSFGSRSCK